MKNSKQIRNKYLIRKDIWITMLLIVFFILGFQGLTFAQNCQAKAEGKKTIAEVLPKVVEQGNLEKLKTMVEKYDVDVNEQLKNDETALTLASYHGQTAMAQYLIDNGADIHKKNKWNNSALSNATMQGHDDIVWMLLKNGADVNEKGNSGYTGLHQAIRKDHPTTVAILIKKGADVNIKDDYNRPPILLASWYGNPEIISRLADAGADLNFKMDDNNSVLHNLAGGGYVKSVQLLLERGADANVKDQNGRLPIHNAAINGYAKIVSLLIPKTIDIGSKENTLGNTPLHIASINGDLETSKMLIEANANSDITNSLGKKPLDYAIKYGYADLVSLCVEKNIATKEDIKSAKKVRESADSKLADGQAKVIYTGHSGWIVQTQNNYLVFDFWDQNLSSSKCLANGAFCEKEMKDKNVYVFVSHDHSDHFDTAIYAWANEVANITYIFGFKPEESWLYQNRSYNGPSYSYIKDNETSKVNDIKVTTIKSNDTGQGFLVQVDGLKIYHPGDHALFTAEDEAGFKKEVDFLADQTAQVDIAFLPVTGCPSRWKKEFIVEGFFYSIQKLNPTQVFPMHAFQREYNLKEFAELAEERKSQTNIVCAENRGDNFIYEKNLIVSK
ncbi:MAG: ankyrin repeat domain-containing protein [Bacteroidales bacterium]|nr:ankyrin repeat domain-containing protein [Bacteroidales bacterium]